MAARTQGPKAEAVVCHAGTANTGSSASLLSTFPAMCSMVYFRYSSKEMVPPAGFSAKAKHVAAAAAREQELDDVRAANSHLPPGAIRPEDDDVVGAYNRYLDRIPGVDITDDYASEKREVEAHGRKLSDRKSVV